MNLKDNGKLKVRLRELVSDNIISKNGSGKSTFYTLNTATKIF
ncbi:MAG: hypothetical protein U0457_12790 [Candidatus Sericytochromatia bacterium]